MQTFQRSALATILLATTALAAEDLGEISFPNSGAAAAQSTFRRGVLLLHSFEYEDAAEAFQAAQAADSDFALAYWGEALTHYHVVWNELDLARGRAVLAKLGPDRETRAAKAPTAREKAYLAAVETLFDPEGDAASRRADYAEATRRTHAAFPDDDEAAALHAVALFGTTGGERDVRTYMRIAALMEEVFLRNPKHPGALHYLIHSYDDPVHAPLGMRAARRYAATAPAAAHALHMPSHIFVALGLWDDVVASNVASWEAGEARVRRKNLDPDEREYHALWWLEYAYLQQGRYDEALKLLRVIEADAAAGSPRAIAHNAYMRAHFLVDSERWEAPVADLPPSDPRGAALAAHEFASGYRALRRGETEAARRSLLKIRERVDDAGRDDPAAAIAMAQLEGLLLLEADEPAKAIERLTLAAQAEDDVAFSYGPPVPVKPAHELLGEALLRLGRAEEALGEFRAALERAPNRSRVLIGLRDAALAAGDEAAAAQALGVLEANWKRADAAVRATFFAATAR